MNYVCNCYYFAFLSGIPDNRAIGLSYFFRFFRDFGAPEQKTL
jgi:hypothetical protein